MFVCYRRDAIQSTQFSKEEADRSWQIGVVGGAGLGKGFAAANDGVYIGCMV